MASFKLSLWQRYLIKRWSYLFSALLIGFLILFIVVDYASSGLQHNKLFQWQEWIYYYVAHLIASSEVLIPFAVLLATAILTSQLNSSRELLALRCGGLCLRRLFFPLIALSFFCSVLLYLNNEVWRPSAEGFLLSTKQSKKQKQRSSLRGYGVQKMPVKDGSTLLYLHYDADQGCFCENYWVKDNRQIFHIRRLYPFEAGTRGEWVEELKRNEQGRIELVSSYAALELPMLQLVDDKLRKASLLPQQMGLMELIKYGMNSDAKSSQQEALLLIFLYKRLFLPLLPLISALLPLPWSVSHQRGKSYTLTFSALLFALATLYLLLDALSVVAYRQLLSPWMAIGLPVSIYLGYAVYGYRKIRYTI